MFKNFSAHLRTVFQALFVTFLWSTSWIIIKFGLSDIPALTFAGLRYTLAFLCLLPFVLTPSRRAALRRLSRRGWFNLILLGVVLYAVTQGAQFLGLAYLPAVTVSLLLNFTTVIVVLLGIFLLAEYPTRLQWSGIVIYLAGSVLYFYPVSFPGSQLLGLVIVLVGVVANACSAILGRHINRKAELPPILITTVSMGIGALLLMISGLAVQGLPQLSLLNWLCIVWLALINTAFAFTLWNHTLRTLSAMESSIINNTMLVQIALLAWLFLGESLTAQEIAGMALAGAGALIVQLRRR